MQDEKSHTLIARHLNVSPGQNLLIKIGKDEFRHKVAMNSKRVPLEVIDEGQGVRDTSSQSPATDGMKTR